MAKQELLLDGGSLDIADVIRVAYDFSNQLPVRLCPKAKERMQVSRQVVDEVVSNGQPLVYGVNTGFGANKDKAVSPEHLRELQRFLIISHAVCVGEHFPLPIVRSAMLIRANSLARGHSGIRPVVVELLIEMLNRGVTPKVPQKGSVGASGDLAPLSHVMLAFTKDPRPVQSAIENDLSRKLHEKGSLSSDEAMQAVLQSGYAFYYDKKSSQQREMSGLEAVHAAGLERIELEAKEGLALNNGTTFSTAIACMALYKGKRLFEKALRLSALSMESWRAFESALTPEAMQARGHEGQIRVAEKLRELLCDSVLSIKKEDFQNSSNAAKDFSDVQDDYSLRAIPQVLGPVAEMLDYVEKQIKTEINGTTDNPLVFSNMPHTNRCVSAANFHAQYMAVAMDALRPCMAELGSIAERRVFKLLDVKQARCENHRLTPFLAGSAGLMSGLMIAQYTAAALVSENKILSHPCVVDSIPTSANSEDHVSMAPIGARKTLEVIENVEYVLAVEALTATTACLMRARKEGCGLSANAREHVALLEKVRQMPASAPDFFDDRFYHVDIEGLKQLLFPENL
jgi:histidine ammonia-lyase